MQLVIADTGPINYLILIGHINVLPALFQKVILPVAVQDELKNRKAPPLVRQWIVDPPPWTEVRTAHHTHDPAMETLDAGEEEAIALAVELHADMILMDDRAGSSSPEAKDSGWREPSAFLPWPLHMGFSISLRRSTVSSSAIFTISKNL